MPRRLLGVLHQMNQNQPRHQSSSSSIEPRWWGVSTSLTDAEHDSWLVIIFMSKVEETLNGCGRFGNSMKFLRKVHPYLHFAGSWWADWKQWQALMATDNGTSASWYVMLLGQKRVSRADSLTVYINRFACMQTPKWVSTWWWGDKGESPQECSAEGPAKLLVILGDMFRNAWEWMPCIPYRVSLSITQINSTCPIFEAPSERCCAKKTWNSMGTSPWAECFQAQTMRSWFGFVMLAKSICHELQDKPVKGRIECESGHGRSHHVQFFLYGKTCFSPNTKRKNTWYFHTTY